MDAQRFGVKAFYIFGSTKNATAGPESDIDILIHFNGTDTQRKDLMSWLEGWSLSLSEANYLRTGHKTDGLLDIHIVTDEDIQSRTSFATKIGAITDAPRSLPMGKDLKEPSAGQISSLVEASKSSSLKRTSASSGPSCAAEKRWVRPILSFQEPVIRADSWTCP